MDQTANFHRSFVDVTGKSRLQDGWEGYERVALQGSFRGYEWNGNMPPVPVDLISKPNQDFRSYATSWEDRCSALLNKSGPRLSPVVDNQATPAGAPVIAHYGTVNGNYIVVPRQYTQRFSGEVVGLKNLLAKDIPAYVISRDYYPDAGGWAQLEIGQNSISYMTVLTDVEGRVLAQEGGAKLKDDTIEKADPLMYLATLNLLVNLGKAVGQRLIKAMARRAAAKEAQAAVTALDKAKLKWGKAEVLEGGAKAVATEAELAKNTMQRAMPQLVNPATSKIRFNTFKEFDTAMKNNGFKMTGVEKFGPDGGYQIFYQNGNVVARFKTLGNASMQRVGQTHVSFSLTDGRGVQWTNDMAKFKANGNLAPKSVVDSAKFKPGNDFQGNPQRFIVIDSNYTTGVADKWANSTHFDAPNGFDLRGVGDVVRGQAH